MRRLLFAVFSLCVTLGVFWYLLRFISLREVLDLLRSIDRRGVLMFLVLSLGMSVFRTWRYALLLNASGYRPGKLALFLVVLVRNFCSDLLPARLGSLVYIFLATTRLGVPGGPATASFAVAFLFDLVALAPLVAAAGLWMAVSGVGLSVWAMIGVACVLALVAFALLAAAPWCLDRGAALTGLMRVRAAAALRTALTAAAADMRSVRKQGCYARVLWLSILVRVCKYGALYAFLFALIKPLGYGLQHMPAAQTFFGILASELMASLPISGIAGFGAYEGAWVYTFDLLGFPKNLAALTAVSHHLFTQVYGYGLGAAALIALMLPVFRTDDASVPEERPRESALRFAARLVGTTLVLALLVLMASRAGFLGVQARAAEEADLPTAEEQASRKQLVDSASGWVLFDSNRSGSFGIYRMRPDGSELQVIADSEQAEMFPDPSPNGRHVVYAKALSPARLAPSSIWICGVDGSNPREIADQGNFPTFHPDGNAVVYEQGRKRVMAVPAAGGTPGELFPGNNPEFDRYQIVKPRMSPDGTRVAFISDRPKAWHTWIANVETGEATLIGYGCEPCWFPEGRRLVLVLTQDARERSGLYTYDLGAKRFSELQDAGSPRGHEYFPTVSREGQYLLWAACRPDQHAHDTANYQLFLRRLPAGDPVRVSFDRYTNRWPKWMPE